jgi:hypothetical protein
VLGRNRAKLLHLAELHRAIQDAALEAEEVECKDLDTIYNLAWVEKVIVPVDERPAPTYASFATELGTEKAFELSRRLTRRRRHSAQAF